MSHLGGGKYLILMSLLLHVLGLSKAQTPTPQNGGNSLEKNKVPVLYLLKKCDQINLYNGGETRKLAKFKLQWRVMAENIKNSIFKMVKQER